ncbi:MAG: dihydrodipicolinate synthase family protein [Armatimonadetes bacterium]|nr:dihydrodipicolinate synthase family protein [Armatimonadota bacterium]
MEETMSVLMDKPSAATVWSATPTPFLADGSLDREGITRLVKQHLRLGVSGLFVGGTCGEGALMTAADREDLVRLVKREAGKALHIAAHVSDTSAARVSDNIRRMADAGADSVVIAPPFMVADFCNRAFMRRYFLEPIESARIPVGIYVRTPPPGMELDLSLWDEAIAHPKVRFVKDSSASEEYMRHFIALKACRSDLTLLTGYEFDVMAAAAAGYDGCLVGTGILNAGMIARGLSALAEGRRDEAERWQARSNAFLYDLFRPDISGWMSGLKYALRKLGVFTSEFAHMCCPIHDEDRRRIDVALEREREMI